MLIHKLNRKKVILMKRIICEDIDGNEILSFDFIGDITVQKYHNCEIADVGLDKDITVIRLQQIDVSKI